jgi:hypothetical protein
MSQLFVLNGRRTYATALLHYAEDDFVLRPRLVGRQLSVDEPFVFAMITNPKPEQTILDLNCQSAILQTNTSRSESPNLFEV